MTMTQDIENRYLIHHPLPNLVDSMDKGIVEVNVCS